MYAALALALVVIVAVIATTATQPPPPTIAEFAPQAIEQIKDAPVEQSSEFGSGAGGSAGAGARAIVPPKVPPIDVPRVRRCVGNPPRQIEDPQSPPCVAYWKGDNGGDTYWGVTRDEIRIKVPSYDAFQNEGFHQALENFFNARFEFYGRKLRLVLGVPTAGPTPEGQRADAAAADEIDKVFASGTGATGAYFYHRELARRKIVSVPILSTSFSSSEINRLHPYIWEYQMSTDRQLDFLGDWACSRFVGKKAVHGGADVRSKKRVFGAMMQHLFPDDTIDLKPLEQSLARCGAKLAEKYEFMGSDPFAAENGSEAPRRTAAETNGVVRMKTAGVTSILCVCVFTEFGNIARAATAQGYFPEWMMTSFHFMDYNVAISQLGGNATEQLAHLFGITFNPKQLPRDQTPVVWAAREGDPAYEFANTSAAFAFALYEYREILALAAGIQMAGPNLTPQTFAAGLQRTQFPNPVTEFMAGDVGFAGDHEMTDTAAEVWWSNTAPSPYGELGAYCYVDHGKRHRKGTFGRDDPMFKGPCDSGAIS